MSSTRRPTSSAVAVFNPHALESLILRLRGSCPIGPSRIGIFMRSRSTVKWRESHLVAQRSPDRRNLPRSRSRRSPTNAPFSILECGTGPIYELSPERSRGVPGHGPILLCDATEPPGSLWRERMFYLRLHEPTIGSALLFAPHAYLVVSARHQQ